MTYRGIIENGRLLLEDGTRLPNGTEVDVNLRRTVRANNKKAKKPKARGAVDSIYKIAELAVDDNLPRDLARQHDHYIYGTPKRRARKRRRT